jgi:hypothetical protein
VPARVRKMSELSRCARQGHAGLDRGLIRGVPLKELARRTGLARNTVGRRCVRTGRGSLLS